MHPLLLALLRILTFYLGTTLTFFFLSLFSIPKSSFYARLLSSYGSLLLCAAYGVLASLFLRAFGDYRISQWATARAFKYTMALTTGIRFEIVEGEEYLDTRPCVLIGNHQSELDVLLLGTIFPRYCSVTAKSSLARTPFLGWFMSLSGTVFIDRADSKGARKVFDGAAEEMKRWKQSVFIFPEGTRSYADGPEMGAFKKGAFHLAVQAGVPVVPVVCANYWGVLSVKEQRFRGGRIPVKSRCMGRMRSRACANISCLPVLPPIPTTSLTDSDVESLTRSTRASMLKELVTLTESPLGQKATKAHVGVAEEDLAELATATASGADR